MSTLHRCAVLVAALVALPATGCVVEETTPVAYADDGYQPAYYDGYVVYYDDVGRPYYYADGAVVWVPESAPVYVGLVHHYRVYGPAYRHWYAHYGVRYRTYRYGHVYGRGYAHYRRR